MTVRYETLKVLERHWAIDAVPASDRKQAFAIAQFALVQRSIGRQLSLERNFTYSDACLLVRVATAYELAAIEGLDALLRPTASPQNEQLRDQGQAAASRAFELRRGLMIPEENTARVFHVLHLAALAYCGDRWTDLRRWLKENRDANQIPSVADEVWDRRITFRLFDAWIRLLRKNQWDDLNGVREIIAGLREDQRVHEANLLGIGSELDSKGVALRLVALYHWAKATELLAIYMLQGEPAGVEAQLDQHYEAAGAAARASTDLALEMLLRWLHVASRRMVAASIWWVAQTVNSKVTRFVDRVTKVRSMFELLPPQKAAVQEQGLLDQASRAVIVNLPTSGGKTVLAQFRMLQALNQFEADQGWVAYVAPTRALVSQITRRLRADFEPLKINVEQLSAAVEIDSCEQMLLHESTAANSFHVLVATPEKLSIVIRNKTVSRPLALVVVDEAHNIEDENRGLRIELLLATIKGDSPTSNYLLMMPYVPNADDLAKWLAPESGKTISIGTSAWLPNDRVVGIFDIERQGNGRGSWSLFFETLTTTPRTIQLKGRHNVGESKPLNIPFSKASLSMQTGAMAKVFSRRGTSIAIARTIRDVWSMAREVSRSLPRFERKPSEIGLVQRFLETEIGPDFELIEMLDHGVAVHHAGLPEEARSLVEWLTEIQKIRVLCATTTIAQGINFPVASVFLSSIHFASQTPQDDSKMPRRAFWNLAGRAGRIQHDSVGVVGIAAGQKPDEIRKFVRDATEDLISRLVSLLRNVEHSKLPELIRVIERDEWTDFRSYIAHLWNEKKNLDAVLAETEQVLRNTFGYGVLRGSQNKRDHERAEALLEATKKYAAKLKDHPENANLADATGFSPEGVRAALLGLSGLRNKLRASDWEPKSLFTHGERSALPQLVGVMMAIPQLREPLEGIGSKGLDKRYVADIAQAWVSGRRIDEIAKQYFAGSGDGPEKLTQALSDACRAIYRTLANYGTWGLSALSKMPTSGLDFSKLPPDVQKTVNNLPAMLYHGVNTEEAVMMRMNSVPRTIAIALGEQFANAAEPSQRTVRGARAFLRDLTTETWQSSAPHRSKLTGEDYRNVWLRLSGEGH